MKTKRNILALAMLLTIGSAAAQTNYYPKKADTLYLDDCTYCYKEELGVRIYNIENMPYEREWKRADSSPTPEGVGFGYIDTFVRDPDVFKLLLNVMNKPFTAEILATIKGDIMMELRIDPATGDVTDVYFIVHRGEGYESLPPTFFRGIELEIKDRVHFTVTEEGRKMTYCMIVWLHTPKLVRQLVDPVNRPKLGK